MTDIDVSRKEPEQEKPQQGDPTILDELSLPLVSEHEKEVNIGQWKILSGCMLVITRVAADRLLQDIEHGRSLPFESNQQFFFLAETTPTPYGQVMGSVGPAHAKDFDSIMIELLQRGAKGFIARGAPSPQIQDALKTHQSLYFITPHGASALLASSAYSSKLIAYKEDPPNAIRRIQVSGFPIFIAVDHLGQNHFNKKASTSCSKEMEKNS